MAKKTQSYRELKTKLDSLLAKMQDPATDIDEALVMHEAGQKLLANLEKYLKDVDKKIAKPPKD